MSGNVLVICVLKSRSTVDEDLLLSTSANEPRMCLDFYSNFLGKYFN